MENFIFNNFSAHEYLLVHGIIKIPNIMKYLPINYMTFRIILLHNQCGTIHMIYEQVAY